jgi:hypothetical protein
VGSRGASTEIWERESAREVESKMKRNNFWHSYVIDRCFVQEKELGGEMHSNVSEQGVADVTLILVL